MAIASHSTSQSVICDLPLSSQPQFVTEASRDFHVSYVKALANVPIENIALVEAFARALGARTWSDEARECQSQSKRGV